MSTLAELQHHIDMLAAAAYWNAVAADKGHPDTTQAGQVLQTCRERATRAGATTEQLEDAISYPTQQWRMTGRCPLRATTSFEQFSDEVSADRVGY